MDRGCRDEKLAQLKPHVGPTFCPSGPTCSHLRKKHTPTHCYHALNCYIAGVAHVSLTAPLRSFIPASGVAPGILPLWTTGPAVVALPGWSCCLLFLLCFCCFLRSFHLFALHCTTILSNMEGKNGPSWPSSRSPSNLSICSSEQKKRSQARASWTNVLKKRIRISQVSVFCDESRTSPPEAPRKLAQTTAATCCRGVPIVGLGGFPPGCHQRPAPDLHSRLVSIS